MNNNNDSNSVLEQVLIQSFSAKSNVEVARANQYLEQLSQNDWGPALFLQNLLHIATNNPSLNIRMAAILIIKRICIQQNWNTSALDQQAKSTLKQNLLQICISDTSPNVQLHASISFSLILRLEYPDAWPDAINFLLSFVNTQDLAQKRAGFQIICLFLKDLTTHTGVESQDQQNERVAQGVLKNAEALFGAAHTAWETSFMYTVECFKHKKEAKEPIDILHQQISLLSHKVLHNMICYSFVPLGHSIILSVIEKMMKNCEDLTAEGTFEEFEYYLNYPSKFALIAQSKQPADFRVYILPLTNFLIRQISGFPPKKVVINTLQFLHDLLREPSYNRRETAFDLTQLFTPEFLSTLGKLLLHKWMVLSVDDIELWEDDPQAYANEDLVADWSYHIPSACEIVYGTLNRKFPTVFPSVLLDTLNSLEQENNNSEQALMVKDACFFAISVSCIPLRNTITFPQLIEKFLLPEMIANPPSKFLRKRVAQIIEGWCFQLANTEPHVKTQVYQIIATLMSDDDFPTRIRAAVAVRDIVTDGEFDAELFEPFVPSIIQSLAQLAAISTEIYTTKQLLDVLRIVCVAVKSFDRYAQNVIELLAKMWQSFPDRLEIRESILEAIAKLIPTLGDSLPTYTEFFSQIISSQLEGYSGSSSHVMKAVLKLWVTMVSQNGFQFTSGWFEMYSAFVKILVDSDFEFLSQFVKLSQAYLEKSPNFMEMCGNQFVQGMAKALCKPPKTFAIGTLVSALKVMEYLMVTQPQVLEFCGPTLLQRFLEFIQADAELRIQATQYHVMFVGRILLLAPEIFFRGFTTPSSESLSLENLIDLWLEIANMDYEIQKISSLSFLKLLESPQTQNLFLQNPARINGMLTILIKTLEEEEPCDFSVHQGDPYHQSLNQNAHLIFRVLEAVPQLAQQLDEDQVQTISRLL